MANKPSTSGVPRIAPEVALIERPEGRPFAINRVGEFEAETWKENGEPTLAFAEAALVTTGGAGRRTRLNGLAAVPAGFAAESVTEKIPAADGVPVMSPVVEFTLSPAGSPLAPNDRGLLRAVIRKANGAPEFEVRDPVFVMTGRMEAIENVRFCEEVPPEFAAPITAETTPSMDGIPAMSPDVALIVRPGGSPEAEKPVGLLVATIWWESGNPKVPFDVAGLVINGRWGRTRKGRLFVAVPAGLVADRIAVKFPGAVGVPVMFPVVEFTERPGGSPVAPKLRGAFVALMGSENGKDKRGIAVPLF